MNFLLGIVEKGTPEQAQAVVHQILDLLWLFMEVRFLTRAQARLSDSILRKRGMVGSLKRPPSWLP